MNKRTSYLLFLYLVTFLCIPGMQAQQAPWVYAGGEAFDDEVTDMVLPFSYNRSFACVHGGDADSISFFVISLDRNGELIWKTGINVNGFEEVPNSIALNYEEDVLRVTGIVNPFMKTWAVDLEASSGNIIQMSEWSGITEDSSGISAFAAPDTGKFIMYTYESGKLSCYRSYDLSVADLLQSYNFPSPINDRQLIISDCETSVYGPNVIVGNFGSDLHPYVWLLSGIDSIYFDELTTDTILFNAVSPKDSGFVVVGNTVDSSGLFLATWNRVIGNYSPGFQQYYLAPGYPIVGKDIVLNFDGTYYFLTVHYDPTGTRTVLMHLDETGEIISETTLFPEEKVVELSHIVKPILEEDPYVLGGFIQTETPEKENEYLVCSTDEMPFWPGCVYDCVWPGDANNNGAVDMTDLFPIGAFYGSNGAERDSTSIYWIGNVASEWADNIDDLNSKYANCDGDPTVEFPDTMAILNNYTFEHSIFTLKAEGGDIPIWLNTTGIILEGSAYIEIPIMLGTEEFIVDSIYGLEFTITYEGLPVIDSNTLRVKFYDSWFGNTSEFLQLDTLFMSYHKVDAGLVLTTHINATGFGEIGKLSFVVEDNIAGIMMTSDDSSVIFNISGPTGVLKDLTETSISGSAYEVLVATGVDDIISADDYLIFPNPWHGEDLTIYPSTVVNDFDVFELTNLQGQTICRDKLKENMIHLPDQLAAGSYILKLSGEHSNINIQLIHL